MSLSLTTRISLLFAIGAASVLLSLGWLVTRAVDAHFVEMDRHELDGKLALVRNLLARARDAEALAGDGAGGLVVEMAALGGSWPSIAWGADRFMRGYEPNLFVDKARIAGKQLALVALIESLTHPGLLIYDVIGVA